MALTPTKIKQLQRAPVESVLNRVALAIELSGETQGAVASALGWTQAYLSNVCRGKFQTITVDNAHKLAEYFGCAIEDLFPSKAEVA